MLVQSCHSAHKESPDRPRQVQWGPEGPSQQESQHIEGSHGVHLLLAHVEGQDQHKSLLTVAESDAT